MRPLLSVVIPTQGRETLPRALASIRRGQIVGAEVVIVADTHSPLLSDVGAVAQTYGARYLELDAGRHDYGYDQIQRGMERASGEYVLSIGDDDEYLPGALDGIAAAIAEQESPRPLLFKAVMKWGQVLWDEPVLRMSHISTQNICAPNLPEMLGSWLGRIYQADYLFIAETVAKWCGLVAWRDEVIVQCH